MCLGGHSVIMSQRQAIASWSALGMVLSADCLKDVILFSGKTHLKCCVLVQDRCGYNPEIHAEEDQGTGASAV